MPLKLKSRKALPNGGFLFDEAGRHFNEMISFTGKAKLILIFRSDNNLPRATLAEVSEDLENAVCNQHPEICFDSNVVLSVSGVRQTSSCASCGGRAA